MTTNTPTLGERLLAHLVQPVPESIALCEFHCSATRCSPEQWHHCHRRLAPGSASTAFNPQKPPSPPATKGR